MWPRRDLIDLLGVAHPIIQAPMAGSTTPTLVAAVSNAGGVGSLGCARMGAGELMTQAQAIRAGTNGAFNLNFFVHENPPAPSPQSVERMQRVLAPYYRELDAGAVPDPHLPLPVFDPERLAAVLEVRPPVLSFHFGMPDRAAMAAIKKAGMIVLGSATTVAEARALEAEGADAIIAQGYEAGGHRGTFAGAFDTGTVSTLPLVPQIVDAVQVPVIAAGGIADGRGIAAAFALGASGVQLGTAFLPCPESGIAPLYRAALRSARDSDTRITRSVSGRPARGLRNRYFAEMEAHDAASLAFPLQSSLSAPLAAAGAARGSDEFLAMWAGQAAALGRSLPAAELVEVLVNEAAATFRSLGGAR